MKTIKTTAVLIALLLGMLIAETAQAQLFPTVTLSPDPMTFPNTRVNVPSTAMTMTATRGSGKVPVGIFGIGLGDSTNFSIQNDGCTGAVLYNDGDSCTVDIVFNPVQRGHFSTTFSIVSLSKDILDTALIEGNGVEPTVALSTTSVEFGPQTINTTSAPYEVTMVNSGNDTLNITSIEASDDFAVTDDCGDTLDADASCILYITFSPTVVQDYEGTVTITDDASTSPQTISLTGNGIPPGSPDADLSTKEVDFGGQIVNTTSSAHRVTLTNTGTVNLTITSITASDDFAQTNNCGAVLIPDASCAIDITFTPPSTGTLTGTVTLVDNATDSPQTIDLSGIGVENTGPMVSLSSDLLDFGEIQVNTKSDPIAITLTNTGGSDLVITDIQFNGENPQYFYGVDDCESDTIPPGRSCSGAITFYPTEKGTFVATITITDNATDSPQLITLTGSSIHMTNGCSLVQSATGMPAANFTAVCFAVAMLVAARFRRLEK